MGLYALRALSRELRRTCTSSSRSRSGGIATSEELDEAAVSSRLRVQPGLLANGVGTTNSAASVSYRTISSNTAWKYAPNTFFFTDGRKYDPATGQDTY